MNLTPDIEQREINQREWNDPQNWSVGFYFSKQDSRTWVPKRPPWMGWTLNLATKAGALWMIGFLVGIPLLVVISVVLATSCR